MHQGQTDILLLSDSTLTSVNQMLDRLLNTFDHLNVSSPCISIQYVDYMYVSACQRLFKYIVKDMEVVC